MQINLPGPGTGMAFAAAVAAYSASQTAGLPALLLIGLAICLGAVAFGIECVHIPGALVEKELEAARLRQQAADKRKDSSDQTDKSNHQKNFDLLCKDSEFLKVLKAGWRCWTYGIAGVLLVLAVVVIAVVCFSDHCVERPGVPADVWLGSAHGCCACQESADTNAPAPANHPGSTAISPPPASRSTQQARP